MVNFSNQALPKDNNPSKKTTRKLFNNPQSNLKCSQDYRVVPSQDSRSKQDFSQPKVDCCVPRDANCPEWSPNTCSSVLKLIETCGPFTVDYENVKEEYAAQEAGREGQICCDPCYVDPGYQDPSRPDPCCQNPCCPDPCCPDPCPPDPCFPCYPPQQCQKIQKEKEIPTTRTAKVTIKDDKEGKIKVVCPRPGQGRRNEGGQDPVTSKRSIEIERGNLGLQPDSDSLPIWVTPSRTICDVERELIEIHNALLDTPNKMLMEIIEQISDLEIITKSILSKNSGMFEQFVDAYRSQDLELNELAKANIMEVQIRIGNEEKRTQDAISKKKNLETEMKLLDKDIKILEKELISQTKGMTNIKKAKH